MGHSAKAWVTYTKQSGEEVRVNFGSVADAESYAQWMCRADPGSKPKVNNLEEDHD